jgi:hypothetical protein
MGEIQALWVTLRDPLARVERDWAYAIQTNLSVGARSDEMWHDGQRLTAVAPCV